MKLPSLRPKLLLVMTSLTPILAVSAPPSATAEVFFRPFGYAFHRPIAEPDPDVSPRRIAAILARRGFRLVGPLGYRGDQIVAAGVDARGVRVRFLVDPYEGEILSSWRVGPPVAHHAPLDAVSPAEPYDPPDALPPETGEPRVIPGIGGETRRPAQPRAATPPRAKTAAHPAVETAPRAVRHPAPSQSGKASPAPSSPPAAAAPAAPPSAAQTPAPVAPAPEIATTPPAAPTPSQATTPPAAPVGAESVGPAPAPAAPSAPAATVEQPQAPTSGAANGTEPQPHSGG